MMEFFNETYHTARKEHCCECCERKIQIGERYSYQAGKFEGEFFDRRYHIDCSMKMKDFWEDNLDYDGSFTYDEMRDWWYDTFCYNCKFLIENGGNCDSDMDRRIWCTRYRRGDSDDKP